MARKKTLTIFNRRVCVYKKCSIRHDMDHHLYFTESIEKEKVICPLSHRQWREHKSPNSIYVIYLTTLCGCHRGILSLPPPSTIGNREAAVTGHTECRYQRLFQGDSFTVLRPALDNSTASCSICE